MALKLASRVGSADNGSGIKAAIWAGAKMQESALSMFFNRTAILPDQVSGREAQGKTFWFGEQPFLKVNLRGERFTNESGLYEYFTHAVKFQPDYTYCDVWDSTYAEDCERFEMVGCSRLFPFPNGAPSNWTLERTLEANEYASAHGLQGFTVCSPNYSYARLVRDPWGGSVTISGNANAPFRKWLAETKMPVFNYSSLGRGYLSGRYRTDGALPVEDCIAEAPILEYHSPENVERLRRLEVLAKEKEATVSQIAMAWLLHQPLNLFPITSPTSEKHMRETVHAFDIALTDGDLSFLDQPIPEDEP